MCQEFGVKELDWPAQSPVLQPIQHHNRKLHLNASCKPGLIAQHQSHLTNSLVAEWEQMPDDLGSLFFGHEVNSGLPLSQSSVYFVRIVILYVFCFEFELNYWTKTVVGF